MKVHVLKLVYGFRITTPQICRIAQALRRELPLSGGAIGMDGKLEQVWI
jgi:hypothetical protein